MWCLMWYDANNAMYVCMYVCMFALLLACLQDVEGAEVSEEGRCLLACLSDYLSDKKLQIIIFISIVAISCLPYWCHY
jgi:hypothetical protein